MKWILFFFSIIHIYIYICEIFQFFPKHFSVQITDLGAELKRACNNGYYPIHEAAKNASSRTMEVFLQWGESKGCSRDSMISLYDNEGNVPLHSAVHGGDIKAVELCLKSGAKISTQQYDLSTPVHLACAQVCFSSILVSDYPQISSRLLLFLYVPRVPLRS